MSLSEAKKLFIQEFSGILMPWGMPQSMGRVFAYLMTQSAPVSLDRIAEDLELSKTSAWNITRDMVNFGHATRHSMPGSKQALFSLSKDFATPLVKMTELLGHAAMLLNQCAESIDETALVDGLQQRADFYSAIQNAIGTAIRENNSRLQQS